MISCIVLFEKEMKYNKMAIFFKELIKYYTGIFFLLKSSYKFVIKLWLHDNSDSDNLNFDNSISWKKFRMTTTQKTMYI